MQESIITVELCSLGSQVPSNSAIPGNGYHEPSWCELPLCGTLPCEEADDADDSGGCSGAEDASSVIPSSGTRNWTETHG